MEERLACFPRGHVSIGICALRGAAHVSGSRRSEYYGRPLTLEDSATFRQALRASPWIPTNEEGQMAESAAKGDWDPVLGVVLPALRNLRILVLHRGLGHFSAPILMRLASSPQQSTLMNLQHVRCNMSNGIGLMGAAPFLAFPSVQTALLESGDDDNFEWPSSLPRSHTNLVWFMDSAVSTKAIRGLARGIVGPCEIIHGSGGHGFPVRNPNYDWDYCRIPFADAGPNDLVLRIKG